MLMHYILIHWKVLGELPTDDPTGAAFYEISNPIPTIDEAAVSIGFAQFRSVHAGVAQCRDGAMQGWRNAGCMLHVACSRLPSLIHSSLTHFSLIPSNPLVYTPKHSYTRTRPFQLQIARCGAMVHLLASTTSTVR
jgi:hypothetical protein